MASRDTGLKACQRGHKSAFGASTDSRNVKPNSGVINIATTTGRNRVVGMCCQIIGMA